MSRPPAFGHPYGAGFCAKVGLYSLSVLGLLGEGEPSLDPALVEDPIWDLPDIGKGGGCSVSDKCLFQSFNPPLRPKRAANLCLHTHEKSPATHVLTPRPTIAAHHSCATLCSAFEPCLPMVGQPLDKPPPRAPLRPPPIATFAGSVWLLPFLCHHQLGF